MGFLARLRGSATPDARVGALADEILRTRNARVPMYQNDTRIGQEYEQRLPNVKELLEEVGLSVGGSGGVPGVITAEGARTQSQSQMIQMTPLLQALLLEESERERGGLVDLSLGVPRAGSLLRFVGFGHVFLPSQEVTELADPRLDSDDAAAIETARRQQQQAMEEIGQADGGTAVWIWRGLRPLASIASLRWLDAGNFRSYMRVPPFGILGKLEAAAGDAVLLAPLLIWHETAVGEGPGIDLPAS